MCVHNRTHRAACIFLRAHTHTHSWVGGCQLGHAVSSRVMWLSCSSFAISHKSMCVMSACDDLRCHSVTVCTHLLWPVLCDCLCVFILPAHTLLRCANAQAFVSVCLSVCLCVCFLEHAVMHLLSQVVHWHGPSHEWPVAHHCSWGLAPQLLYGEEHTCSSKQQFCCAGGLLASCWHQSVHAWPMPLLRALQPCTA